MSQTTWTPEQDYALAFGAALGMSARQIAGSMATTRNAVIGRSHRLDISLNGKRPRVEKPARERVASVPRTRIHWTPEQDAALTAGVMAGRTSVELAPELGHTVGAVTSRRTSLGLARSMRRFTPEEDAVIRADYASFVQVEETARKIGRSYGVVRQRILSLGLSRDGRKTRLAERFGVASLALSDDPAQIRRILAGREQEKRGQADAAEAVRIAAVLADMQRAIEAGEPRAIAFRAAMLQGATLQAIGDLVGLTRERIRQLTDEKRRESILPRRLTCLRCSSQFEAAGKGNHKHCAPCREIREEEKRQERLQYSREYSRRLRQTPEWKTYKREWTSRSRLKEKLTALEPTDLASLLRQVANEVVQASKTGGEQ